MFPSRIFNQTKYKYLSSNYEAPMFKLVKVDNLDIIFYIYKTFDLLAIDVNLNHKFV